MILLISNTWISVTEYSLSPVSVNGVRIVLISDLHGCEFGEDNQRLIEGIAEQEADMICLAGDMFSEPSDMGQFLSLVTELVKLAPTFISYGNTEKAFEQQWGNYWVHDAERLGAIVLDESFVDVEIGGQKLRVGGLFNYAFTGNEDTERQVESDTFRFLDNFGRTNTFKILLCHRPDSFIFHEAYDDWKIDVLLCGHTHGGLVRLPFLGGLYVPDQGWFPQYDKGCFSLGEIKMVITSGLTGYGWIPRIMNPPEITLICLGE